MSCGCGCACGAPKAADLNDEHTVAVFRGAVENANQKNGTNLQFVKVVSATQKVVSGFEFEGVVETNEGNYKVKAWVKAGGRETEYQVFEKA